MVHMYVYVHIILMIQIDIYVLYICMYVRNCMYNLYRNEQVLTFYYNITVETAHKYTNLKIV